MADNFWHRVRPGGLGPEDPRAGAERGDSGWGRVQIHYIVAGYKGYAAPDPWGRGAIKAKLNAWFLAQEYPTLDVGEEADMDKIFDHMDSLTSNGKTQYAVTNNEPAFIAASAGVINEAEWRDTLNIQ